MPRLLTVVVLSLLVTAAQAKDIVVTPDYFDCVTNWTKIRNTRIHHPRRKRLEKAIRIFERGTPKRRYPVGTVLQLVPFEAMVKHRKRFFPETDGWEFFALDVSSGATVIRSRGGDAINFLGRSCKTCHAAAARFDWVCEQGHGCDPIPLTESGIGALQEGDRRCR